jgi:hypothetical protein
MEVIKSASYYCYDKPGDNFTGYKGGSKEVYFYTFDGKLITTVENRGMMDCRLDPDSPKPQVLKYKIKYWAGIPLGGGLTYVPTGNLIVFHDNNGDGIGSNRYKGIAIPPTSEDLEMYRSEYNLDHATYDGYDESEREMEEAMSTKGSSCTLL